MKNNLNSAYVITTLVRTFFDGFAKGMADAHDMDFSNKQEVKKMMLNHYENISKSYAEVMFSILSVVTHRSFDEVEVELQQLSAEQRGDVGQLFAVACNDSLLYDVMVEAYKSNFSYLLEGRVSSVQEHLSACEQADSMTIKTAVGEEIVLRLLVRTVVQAYLSGMRIGKTDTLTLKQSTIYALLITNVNILINHAPIDESRLSEVNDVYDYLKMVCGTQEHCHIIFSEMENEMKHLTEI